MRLDAVDKMQAWTTAAAVNHLRARLTEICEAGDQACNAAAASVLPDGDKLTQLNAIKDRLNSDAAGASRAAVTKIVSVIQQLLDVTDSNGTPPNGLLHMDSGIAEPPPPPPIAKGRLR